MAIGSCSLSHPAAIVSFSLTPPACNVKVIQIYKFALGEGLPLGKSEESFYLREILMIKLKLICGNAFSGTCYWRLRGTNQRSEVDMDGRLNSPAGVWFKALFNLTSNMTVFRRRLTTNGSQFFITHVKQPHLNGPSFIFRRVTHGFEVLELMEKVPWIDLLQRSG